MALSIAPRSRYMILCDEVLRDETRENKLLIVGLTSLVIWPEGTTTPIRLEKLVILLILTDGHGTGLGRIVCVNEETGAPIFAVPPRELSFVGKDASGHYGVTFKILEPHFPAPGAYSMQFFFDDVLVDEKLLSVR